MSTIGRSRQEYQYTLLIMKFWIQQPLKNSLGWMRRRKDKPSKVQYSPSQSCQAKVQSNSKSQWLDCKDTKIAKTTIYPHVTPTHPNFTGTSRCPTTKYYTFLETSHNPQLGLQLFLQPTCISTCQAKLTIVKWKSSQTTNLTWLHWRWHYNHKFFSNLSKSLSLSYTGLLLPGE